MDILKRHHVTDRGGDGQPMVFAHGFGCDQSMWRFVAPEFEKDKRVVLFDLAGSGQADPSAYDRSRHATLDGYVHDVLNIIDELDLRDVIFVGHSVSATIGALAAIERPERFSKLVLVGPSPRYINDEAYVGGFSRGDIEGLLDAVESNYLGWASSMAPVIMGTPDRPELNDELVNSFCRTQPEFARAFARVTFLSDNRQDLPRVKVPTLILQSADDVIAPVAVGEYVHRQIPQSKLTVLDSRGHCPHLSAPKATVEAINAFLSGP